MTLPIAPQANQVLEAGLALSNEQTLLAYLNTKLSGPLNIQAGQFPAAGSAAEVTITQFAIPAGQLAATNQGVKVTCTGNTANTSGVKTVKLYFGVNEVLVAAATISTANVDFALVLEAFKTGASTQQVNAYGNLGSTVLNYQAAGTENDTAAITVKLTSITTASADVVVNCFRTEFLQ